MELREVMRTTPATREFIAVAEKRVAAMRRRLDAERDVPAEA